MTSVTAPATEPRTPSVQFNKMEKQGALVVAGVAALQEVNRGLAKFAILTLISLLSIAVYKSADVPFPADKDSAIASAKDEVAEVPESQQPDNTDKNSTPAAAPIQEASLPQVEAAARELAAPVAAPQTTNEPNDMDEL